MQLAPGLKINISCSFLSAEAKEFAITALDREFKGLKKEGAGQDSDFSRERRELVTLAERTRGAHGGNGTQFSPVSRSFLCISSCQMVLPLPRMGTHPRTYISYFF